MNEKKYIGFSFYKKVIGIENISYKNETYYTENKINNNNNGNYYKYNNKEIITNSLHNCIFLIKNFEKDFFLLNGENIKNILKSIDIKDFQKNIINKPNSEFLRKIGFLLESYLNIGIDLGKNFIVKKIKVNILNDNIFVTNKSYNIINKKYNIIDNSLGKIGEFNPLLIKDELNKNIFEIDFNKNLKNINNSFDSVIIEKAINYLYTKETKGSLEIEGENFNQNKNRGFLKLISNIPIKEKLDKNDILKYYNTIYVDKLNDYRKSQNFIGSGNGMMGENIIEYISPKSEDLESLMNSLIYFYNKNKDKLNPILLSVILSTQFVLIHPFIDGNGRTSRFLFQYSLLNSGIGKLGEDKIILPVSAYILLNKDKYYKELECISSSLLDFIEYKDKGNGDIEVLNNTQNIYTNLNFTNISNYFYEILDKSINIDYKKELNYINTFYNIYTFIDSHYNIPSNNISFITKVLIENKGIISNTKFKILEKRGINKITLKEIEIYISKNKDYFQ